jgi:plastocyanin
LLDLVRAAAIGAAVAVAVAACSSSASSGWTFAPPPSATLAPAQSGSAAPGGSGSASAPASASSGTSPGSSGSAPPAGGIPVIVKALNLAFDTQQIQVPGGQPFAIEFDNQDPGIPHNIAIKDPSGIEIFRGEVFSGPGKRTYQVPPLTKGTAYTFQCDVHPTMTGTVSVQ